MLLWISDGAIFPIIFTFSPDGLKVVAIKRHSDMPLVFLLNDQPAPR